VFISESGMGKLVSLFLVVCFPFGPERTEMEKMKFKPCSWWWCLA